MNKKILVIWLLVALPFGLWALNSTQAKEVVEDYYQSLAMYAQNPASNPKLVTQWFTAENVVYNDIYGVIMNDYSRHNQCGIKEYVTYVGGYYNNFQAKLSISHTITGQRYANNEYLVYATKRIVGYGSKQINLTTYEEVAVREVNGSAKIQRIVKKNEPYVQTPIHEPGNVVAGFPQSDGTKFELNGSTVAATGNAIGLSYLTDAINSRKTCQTGALTATVGVVIYQEYGYAYTKGVPNSLADKLKEINTGKYMIHDVAISNNGNYWCVVFGNGGWQALAPEGFYSKIREYLGNGEKIRSVAIRDNGEYVIVSDKHFYASTTALYDVIIAARDSYGTVHSVSLSNKGVVVCAERGVYFKNIPTETYERLKKAAAQFKIRVVKFTDTGTCLITDGKSNYDYWM